MEVPMATLEGKIARLPPWAREHIASLNAKIAELEAPARNAPKTRIQVDPVREQSHKEAPAYLRDNARVRFLFDVDQPQEQYIEVYFDWKAEGVEVHGSSSIQILPGGGNTISVRVRPWSDR
jgi:hypothetical protein